MGLFRRRTDELPDDSFRSIRNLTNDALHQLMEGQKPHSARHIAASREVQWRQDRAHLVLQGATTVISLIALIVAIVALLK
jgi:hypothetical protein